MNGKEIQMNLTGFFGGKTTEFMEALWSKLHELIVESKQPKQKSETKQVPDQLKQKLEAIKAAA